MFVIGLWVLFLLMLWYAFERGRQMSYAIYRKRKVRVIGYYSDTQAFRVLLPNDTTVRVSRDRLTFLP